MPLRRGNQRESGPQKGRDYSDAVIEFMSNHGYFVDSRAEDSGEGEDIVFQPKAGNRSPIVAEAKYRSLGPYEGLSPNDYVEGFAERFYQWEAGAYRDHDFYLFTTNLSNPDLWKDLFERLKDEEIESFYKKMLEETSGDIRGFLMKHDASRFERFLENTVIYGDYTIEDLRRINQRISETGEYDFDPYLEDYEPVFETGIHKTNLIEVEELPPTIYKTPAHEDLTSERFHQHHTHKILPIYYHGDSLYSLIPPADFDSVTTDMCSGEESLELSFEAFACENPTETEVDVSKVLLRGVVTTIANEVGAVVNRERGDTRIYLQHADVDAKVDGQWMTRGMDTGEARHRSVRVFMRFFDGQYFIGLYPTIEFTRDGEQLVSSSRKKSLMESHNQGRYPQNDRKSRTVELWVTELSLDQSLAVFDLPENLQSVVLSRVEGLKLQGVRPPKTPDERKELIESALGIKSESEQGGMGDYV